MTELGARRISEDGAMEIYVFPNGNVACFRAGEQVPISQKSWLVLLLEYLERNSIDGRYAVINMPDGRQARPFKTNGEWNWYFADEGSARPLPRVGPERWSEMDDADVTHFNHFGNPAFTFHHDGRVTVDRWTEEIVFTEELLRSASPKYIKSDGEFLEIKVSNGWARYVLSEARGERKYFKLLESR